MDLQRELARVGCYAGEINGAWTLSTRQAMKIFMERVNATLPIHQPHAVLLALVQSQPGNVCGTSCPAGQSRARDGRCIPTALLSRDFRQEKQPVSANAGWSATTTVASERPPSLEDGQMALAGPKIDTANSEPVRARSARSRVTTHDTGGRDWRAELWKNQN